MKKRFFQNFYLIGSKYPWWVLTISLILAFVGWHFAKQLKIETDFSTLLSPNRESVRNLKKLNEYFGSMGFLYLTVENSDPGKAEKFAKILSNKIEALPKVSYVDFRKPVGFFEKRKWLFIKAEDLQEMERRVIRAKVQEKEGVSSIFSSLMDFADEEDRPDLTFEDIKEKYQKEFGDHSSPMEASQDGRIIILKVKADVGAENYESNYALIGKIKNIEKSLRGDPEFQDVLLGFGGPYASSIETVERLKKEINGVSIGVFIALFLILILFFRQSSGAVLVGLPLVVGILWTGGLIYFFLGRVNIITSFAVSFLAGLGSDYGIYLLSRFLKERRSGKNFQDSCQLTFISTGRATFSAMVTTIGAFASLLFSGFEAFVEFGVIGCVGLFLNYLAYILLLPSLLSIGERYQESNLIQWLLGWRSFRKKGEATSKNWILKIFFPRSSWGVVIPIILVILISLTVFQKQSRIYLESDQLDYQDLPSRKVLDKITEANGSGLDTTIFLVQGKENERYLVSQLTERLNNSSPGELVYKKVLGLSTFIPNKQDIKKNILSRISNKYRMLKFVNKDQKKKIIASIEQSLKSSRLQQQNLPFEVTRNFVSPRRDDVYAVYLFPSVKRGNSAEVKYYTQEILKVKNSLNRKIWSVDPSFISLDIINMISHETIRGFWLILAFLGLILLINLKKIRPSLLIMGHLIAGVVLIFGILYLAKIRLNILNIAVFPIILGTGIDCFIHFYDRLKETRNFAETLREEVGPILVSNLTTIIGFGGLLFTTHQGLKSIGWVCVIGVSIITFLCVFIFPRALIIFDKGNLKKMVLDNKTHPSTISPNLFAAQD